MIGKYQIELGAAQFASGMSTSDYATDGALGVSSTSLNPFSTPGLMRQLASPTDISTNVVGQILASAEDSSASLPNNRYYIDDSTNAAHYYSFNGTSITLQATGTATGTTYVQGKSDLVSYNGFFYASSPSVLNKWNGTGTLTEAYQTFGDGSAWHPMMVYQNKLYIGDGNTVSALNSAGTYTTAVLTLSPKEKIVAMGTDPSTGLLMLSISTVYDVSDTLSSLKAVYLWDGISVSPTRKIIVDDLVTAFLNVEGQVYVGQGLIIGVWNGNGVTYLRKLLNATLTNGDLIYKHHMCSTRNILHVIDGQYVLSYGTIMGQTKGWFNTAYVPNTPSNHMYSISPMGPNKITIAAATNKLWQFDYSAVTAGQITLYFNNIYFPRPIFVRRVRAITTGVTTTSGLGGIFIFDENGNAVAPTSPKNQFVVASGTKYVFDFDYSSLKLQGLQLRFTFDTQAAGFVRFIIYYDIAE